MSREEINYYKFCNEEPLPNWVRCERYEYCDSYDYRKLTAKPVEKKTSLFSKIFF